MGKLITPALLEQEQGLDSDSHKIDSSKHQTNSKITSPYKDQSGLVKQNNSAAAQRQRLEAELRKHPVSTIFARDELDIMMPGARVWELRHKHGLNIQTHWKTEKTSCGNHHRIAEYVLFSDKFGEAA